MCNSLPTKDGGVTAPTEETSPGVECTGSGMAVECTIPEGMEVVEDENPLMRYALILPFFFWGSSMVAMKTVLPSTGPYFVAAMRLIPAGGLLVAYAAYTGRKQPAGAMAWLAIAAFALVDGTMFQGFLALGLEKTSAGLGSVIIDSQPITVAILASLFLGETLSAVGIGGLAIGVLGLLLLELPPSIAQNVLGEPIDTAAVALMESAGPWYNSGEWWMLLAAQSMAVGTVMVRWVQKYVDPVMATGWHMALGGIPLLLLSAQNEADVYTHLGELGGWDWASLAYITILGSAAAYGLFFYFATKGNLTQLSVLTFTTPMFATLFGFLLLGETLSGTQALGAAVTLAGIALTTASSKAEAAKERGS